MFLSFSSIKLWIISLAIVCPISVNIGGIGSKPVDLALSDFLLIFFLVTLLYKKIKLSKNEIKFVQFVFFNIAYFLALGAIAVFENHNGIIPFLSSIRFSKSMLFVVFGMVICKQQDSMKFIKIISTILIFYPFLLLLSDIWFNQNFPDPRWGGLILNQEIFGFPNSSSMFTVILSCFVLVRIKGGVDIKTHFYLMSFILYVALSVMSLSRNAIVSMLICIMSLFLLLKKNVFLFLSLIAFIAVLSYSWDHLCRNYDSINTINNSLLKRTYQTREHIDTFSGRTFLWKRSWQLIVEKPLLGYCFEPFSNYVVGFDTPHQQYLEILHKSGVVGLLLYLSAFGYGVIKSFGVLNGNVNKITKKFAGAFCLSCIALLFSNFFQPNFSYPVTANFVWFFLGWFTSVSEKERRTRRFKQINSF